MDSLFVPPNADRDLKLAKEQIISKFRRDYLANGTKSGAVAAFLSMFSNDMVKEQLIQGQKRHGQRNLQRWVDLRRRGQR